MLEGRRIVVTGASRGIGRAIATAASRAGAQVGVNYHRSEREARSLRDELGSSAYLLPFDVRDPEAVRLGIEKFVTVAGGLDGLVNNAAVNLPSLLVSAEDADIAAMLATNLLGPLACIRAALPAMLAEKSGVIVNVSSVAAERPSRGQAVYAATKGGIEALTRAVAVEYGRKGIRCHAIRPGPVETDMLAATRTLAGEEVLSRIPLRRIASPEEVADFVVFLLGDQARYVTGSVHSVDGGYLLG